MTITEITKLVQKEGNTTEEQILLLRKIRAQLLEAIHSKQQLLDRVDYWIYELKHKETTQNTHKKRAARRQPIQTDM